jgi:integrase
LDPQSNERNAEVLKPCPSVWDVFEATRDQQVELRLAKADTWNGPYRSALKLANKVMDKIGHQTFFERPFSSLAKRELTRMYKWLGHNRSVSTMQAFRSALTKMYSYSYDEGFEGVDHNLGRELQDVVVETRPPKRTRGALSWKAMKLAWFWIEKAVELCALSPRIGLCLQMMLYAGLRPGAVRQLRHEDRSVWSGWTIVAPERDKQKIRFIDEAMPKYVYETATWLELLSRVPDPANRGDGWMFPSRVGWCKGKPISKTAIKFKGFFDKRDNPDLKDGDKGYRGIDIERFERCLPPKDLRPLIPYEFRHTFITRSLEFVRPKGLVSRMAGHMGPLDTLGDDVKATVDDVRVITLGYSHLTFFNEDEYREELRSAWLQWDERFRAEMGLPPVALPQQRLEWPSRMPHATKQKKAPQDQKIGLRIIK